MPGPSENDFAIVRVVARVVPLCAVNKKLKDLRADNAGTQLGIAVEILFRRRRDSETADQPSGHQDFVQHLSQAASLCQGRTALH